MKPTFTTNARVTVHLELDGCGPWGPDCTVGQVQSQAASHARGEIRRLLDLGHKERIRASMVGEPEVRVVILSNLESEK